VHVCVQKTEFISACCLSAPAPSLTYPPPHTTPHHRVQVLQTILGLERLDRMTAFSQELASPLTRGSSLASSFMSGVTDGLEGGVPNSGGRKYPVQVRGGGVGAGSNVRMAARITL
jgi:hypothetical protein